MPSIADQVATIEHDLTAALARIDALTATNAALASGNTALNTENAILRDQVADMQQYVDNTRSMADQIATSTLEMLRASRRPVGQATAEVVQLAPKPFVASGVDEGNNGVDKAPTPYWKNTVAFPDQMDAAHAPPKPTALDAVMDTRSCTCHPDDSPPVPCARKYALVECKAAADARTVLPVNELPRPVATGPMIVEHDDDKLPIFLQRDTPFDRMQVFG